MDDDSLETIPERLYHYTNLEKLALILENRTIRLMPISGMDDLQEAKTADVPNIGRFIFASCWTDDDRESIPMWNMYASLETGVRICLPTMPFKRYRLSAEEYAEATGIPADHITGNIDDFESFLHPSFWAKGLMTPAYYEGNGVLVKVQYTSDKELLEPNVASYEDDRVIVATGMLGKYKNQYWAFQNEWRYKMQIFPFNILDLSGDVTSRLALMAHRMVKGVLPAPCSFFDLEISDEAMDKFEVVASPKMSAGNRLLLQLLLEHHGLEASLRESELTGLI